MAAGATSNFSCGGMEGRYIIFLIPGTGKILNVCELTVYGYMPENAALWRTAVLASQTGSSYARNALDGLPQTCAQTTFQPDPWIRLNLLNEYRINVVTMINSLNLGYVPLNGTTTRIGNDPSYAYNNPSCTKIPNASPVTSTNFSCGGMVGRYVFVHVPGYMAILTLCELEIYGDLIDNRASVGVATQSSTSKDWSADRAIDGDRGLQQINKGCSSTLNETSPWLRVDLLYFYAINRVVITNRNVSNAIQMTGLEIHIGSSLENNGNNNPICAVVPGIPMGESYNYTCNGMVGRYINLILPGDFQMLTLCEVEVFGKGPVLGRSFVRMHFSSTMDLTDQTISKNILQQLKSALAGKGYANMTFVWSESPKMVLGMQKMTPAQHCIKVP